MFAVDVSADPAAAAHTPPPHTTAPPAARSASWPSPTSFSAPPQYQSQYDDAPYPDQEPLLPRQPLDGYSPSSPSPSQGCMPLAAAALGWLWHHFAVCYNRISAWLFPSEPEPLDLQSTIFFVAQVPFLLIVALTWIPSFVFWLLGMRTSQAGDRGKGNGMRRTWTIRMALAHSFLKVYLGHAQYLTIEQCQGRSRSIPFMSAPAGIRVKKVKIPAFPFRPRAEAIVYSHLTDEEREQLALRPRYSQGLDEKDLEVESLSVKAQQDAQSTPMEMGSTWRDKIGNRNQEDLFAEGLDAEWLEYVGKDDPEIESQTSGNPAAVLYFHGGGYYTGSKEEHRVLIGPLVRRLGKNIRILIINYRLAPQHPFPAALVDALSSYMWLMEQPISESFSRSNAGALNSGQGSVNDCFQPSQIVFMGDSAGGGLALSLSLLIRDHGLLPQPLSLVTWSPWLDLTQSLPSFKENALADVIPFEDFVHRHSDAVDKMFSHPSDDSRAHGGGARVRQRAQVYCPDSCLRIKYVSPLFETNFKGIPSVFITCGSAERFFNECVLLAARLEEQKQPCRIDIHEDMSHIFPLFRFHTSASAALDRTCAYIRDVVNKDHAVARSSDVIIPIPSTLSSPSPSTSQSPLLTSKQPDQLTLTLPFSTSPSGQARAGRPTSVYRADSFSSISSASSDKSTSSVGSSTSVSSGRQPSPTVRHGKSENRSRAFDPQSDTALASRVKAAVHVVDLSGCAVLSFHRQTQYGPCEASRADMANSPQRRQHRRKALSLKDVVSDATLYEWEVLLKQGSIPTRHWPLPPNSRA